jgi:hypothetical protein
VQVKMELADILLFKANSTAKKNLLALPDLR